MTHFGWSTVDIILMMLIVYNLKDCWWNDSLESCPRVGKAYSFPGSSTDFVHKTLGKLFVPSASNCLNYKVLMLSQLPYLCHRVFFCMKKNLKMIKAKMPLTS